MKMDEQARVLTSSSSSSSSSSSRLLQLWTAIVLAFVLHIIALVTSPCTALINPSSRRQQHWQVQAAPPPPHHVLPPPPPLLLLPPLSSESPSSSLHGPRTCLSLSLSSSSSPSSPSSSEKTDLSPSSNKEERNVEQNSVYLRSLLANLGRLCDKYIMSGSPMVRERIFNILDQMVAVQANVPENETYIHRAVRLVKRAGVPMHKTYLERYDEHHQQQQQPPPPPDLPSPSPPPGEDVTSTIDNDDDNNDNDDEEWDRSGTQEEDERRRRQVAQQRQVWEQRRREQQQQQQQKDSHRGPEGTSALSRRALMPTVLNPDDIATIANDKESLRQAMEEAGRGGRSNNKYHSGSSSSSSIGPVVEPSGISASSAVAAAAATAAAAGRVSDMIARVGSGHAFEGNRLGIGGLDDVLAEIKRRVWTPLAAPPALLRELGIRPVRGLLLYGKPGCGKTLLASKLGSLLSPFRPITVVSGPEVLDKFVGSSEKNLRAIFDDPPDIYGTFRLNEADGGDALAEQALHVVVMDEFDAIARSRGGQDGKGGQGDAGVARDSVVNQMLAKMDGVTPLPVPTLVIGLTNKRSLVDPALLRPGRFEVQIEIPPPQTIGQRTSILKVHTKDMYDAGRLEVNDPPTGTAASRHLAHAVVGAEPGLLSYEGLLLKLALECDGFSGASLAAVARAAASHALERAVEDFTVQLQEPTGSDPSPRSESRPSLMDCLVTQVDFSEAIQDVRNSMGSHDHTKDEGIIAADKQDVDDPVEP